MWSHFHPAVSAVCALSETYCASDCLSVSVYQSVDLPNPFSTSHAPQRSLIWPSQKPCRREPRLSHFSDGRLQLRHSVFISTLFTEMCACTHADIHTSEKNAYTYSLWYVLLQLYSTILYPGPFKKYFFWATILILWIVNRSSSYPQFTE